MSAPNLSGGEREFDALRRAQRAHEPSMEEILASIRAIIADDRVAEPAKIVPATKPVASVGPQIVYSKDATPALRAVPEAESTPTKMQSPPTPPPEPVVLRRLPTETLPPPRFEPEVVPAPALGPVPEPEPAPPDEPPLLSEEADRQVSESFHALSTTLALQSAELVENLTRELLRPMIKLWLDDHLPSLVERLVRSEIQRVARGGR
jgi:cell pole-organizing protein PopZ